MDQPRDRPFADDKGRSLGEQAQQKGHEVKEDIKGAARRAEGALTGDEGLKQEHDPSILERAGESIKGAAQYVGDTVAEGARKVGLINDKE